MEVTVTNRSEAAAANVIAVVGLPASLDAPFRALDEIKDSGDVDFFELHRREVHLYLRDLAAGEERRVTIDCVATYPGRTRGPASRAWVYYGAHQKSWADPITVAVRPAA